METNKTLSQNSSAFSLIELLTVVASVAILSAVAIAVISNSGSSLKSSQLEQDVSRLNTAINVFLANGGSLDGITTAQDVVTELKKEANTAGQRQVVGMRGSMVDNRLQAIDETNSELRPRAVWKSAQAKFVIEESADGVREFRMNEALAAVDYVSATRNTKLVYNDADGWVWESLDHQYVANAGPSVVPTISAPTLGASSGSGGANSAKLGTPIISPGSGVHALSTFPLMVSIAKDPDDPSDAKIFYSTEPNVWAIYSEPFMAEPGTSVQAYSSNEDPVWDDSDPATATYRNDPEALEIAVWIPKSPINYAEAGGPLEPGDYTPVAPIVPIDVTLPGGWTIPDIYENSDQFQFHWTLDGSDPRTSNTRTTGIKFTNGYKNNNGHGNNYSGIDVSNPAYIKWAEENGVDLTAVVDDEIKPHDKIAYTITEWDGATLLPIQVVAQSKNTALVTNSAVISSNIGISRTNLRPPAISYPDEASRGDTVEISTLVDFGDMPVGARVYYTTDGTDPGHDGNGNPLSGTLYTGSFDPLLNEDEFAGEATIIARVYPPQEYAHWFNVSLPSSSLYLVPTWEISGVATGWLSNEWQGASNSLWDVATGSYFQWSDSLNTGAESFVDISNRERFQIGKLSYYNGSGWLAGEAGSIDFAVQLDLGSSVAQFDYSLDQFVTWNDGTEWENADLISFGDSESAQSISLYGADYALHVEFGETTSNGSTTLDQFQVLEGETATANLYANLVSLGSWW